MVPFTSIAALLASVNQESDCTKHAFLSLMYTVNFDETLHTTATMKLQLFEFNSLPNNKF